MTEHLAIRARDRATRNLMYFNGGDWVPSLDDLEFLYTDAEMDAVFSVVLMNWVSHVDDLSIIEVDVAPDGKRTEISPEPQKVGFLGRLFRLRSRS